MNGRPPTATPIPPSVQQARRQQSPGRRAWTGLWSTRIVGVLLALAAVAIIGAKVAGQMQSKKPPTTPTESTMEPTWGRQAYMYKGEAPAPPPEPKPPVDTISPEVARLRAEMAAMKQEMADLKNREAMGVANNEEKRVARTAPGPRGTPPPTLFVSHDLGKATQAPGSKTPGEPTYTLMPGYFLPCITETAMNSDTGDFTFVAVISSTVYDTETGRYPLIFQGSKIVGEAQGSQLLYGNERIRTVSLSLSRRQDKTPIDLGTAPVTDQAGIAGLTGKVNQHYWRLFGAVFIGGALRGGTQAMQTAITGTGPIGQIGTGIGQAGGQVVQGQTSRALDTRPTIEISAGQLCNVILTKPLQLTVAR